MPGNPNLCGRRRQSDTLMQKPSKLDALEHLHVQGRQELRDWLFANHLTSPGVWLVTYRTVTGKPRPRYDEIVDELVSFGWIDSKLVKLDETMSMLLCTPRNPRSHWSASNKQRVARLMDQGLMSPRGHGTRRTSKGKRRLGFPGANRRHEASAGT